MPARRAVLSALAAAALAGCARSLSVPQVAAYRPARPRGRPAAGSGGDPLAPFFGDLAALDAHAARRPVSIIQVGDSHSAGDYFSARLRDRFQARFGAAGRGLLPPGRPDRYYDPKLVRVTEAGWTRDSARGGAGPIPFGIAGVTQTATGPARMTLTSDEAEGFDRIDVVFRRLPQGGSFAVSVDGGAARMVSTRGADETVRATFEARRGSRTVTLETQGDGEVALLAWGTWRHVPGVLYQNFGIIGAQVDVLGRYDAQSLATELQDAALLVVEYGTNEAFGSAADLADYQERFRRDVAVLADAAPQASVLIVGPPDVNRSAGAAGGGATLCTPDRLPQATPEAAWPDGLVHDVALQTSRHAAAHGGGHHAARHGSAHGAARGGHARGHAGRHAAHYASVWARPAQVDMIAAAQHGVAGEQGWYFWDWSAAMGGPCAMVRWVGEHLGRGDHVHMTAAGYGDSADLLFDDLMHRYDAWRAPAATARPGRG